MVNAKPIGCFAALIFAIGLSGCAGIRTSSRPIYPDTWSSLVAPPPGRECADLSGKYVAVSDEAGPLVYPRGGHPREHFFFVPLGKPEPLPQLGRRILPWHLAGAFESRNPDAWNALARYTAALEVNASHSEPKRSGGWVQIQELPDGILEVFAGFQDQIQLKFVLEKRGQGLWSYKSHVYECEDGDVVVIGNFPPPPVENPSGAATNIGARCTFFRAGDGSLVMLEDAYTGVDQGNMVFKKWWRWRPIPE